MTIASFSPIPAGQSVPRHYLVTLLRTALAVGSDRFARQAALTWLAHYPGDLPVNLLYAQALIQGGLTAQAVPVLEKICQADPEYLEAQALRQTAHRAAADKPPEVTLGNLFTLGKEVDSSKAVPDWAYKLRAARTALSQEKVPIAEELVHQALLEEGRSPLAAIIHLEAAARQPVPPMTARDLAMHYHKIWPECLVITLRLADALVHTGDAERAVALLHRAAANDVTGQVATRLWGTGHAYQSLWPVRLEAPLELAIPAPVAAALGWNQLPDSHAQVTGQGDLPALTAVPDAPVPLPKSGAEDSQAGSAAAEDVAAPAPQEDTPHREISPPKFYTVPESLRFVQDELERVADRLNQTHLTKTDGRFPVYVIFTARNGLQRQYGAGFAELDRRLRSLASTIESRDDWRALLLYADDPDSMNAYGLAPAKADDPWELKLALVDLDATLAKHGEMIGAVLIVGGPEVVPFHHLPNPVDDADVDAPSDNPYATRDENYFVPEWPVGRLPGGVQSDPQAILSAVQAIIDRHSKYPKRMKWYQRWWRYLRTRFRLIPRRDRPSWGYTAAVWRRASLSVFRPIGPPHSMLVSPPVQVDGRPGRTLQNKMLPSARLGYFNLHGVQDASEWFGQRDPTEPTSSPDYPVALRPQDVLNGGRAPQVVFSEACYGAHIAGKSIDEALALKFLASGSQAVVGSTCTAYGSITPPLIAADLLGHTFWKYLREGLTAGEALRRAKIHLAREMLRRQGYLDGEDQKTLITFVYYGDPLAEPVDFGMRPKAVFRPLKHPKSIKTVCDRARIGPQPPSAGAIPPIPEQAMAEVKRVVEQYLPGMQGADLLFCQEHADCNGEHHVCPTSQFSPKWRPSQTPNRSVVTLSKHIEAPEQAASGEANQPRDEEEGSIRVHWHYARLTFGPEGNVVKLAVSR